MEWGKSRLNPYATAYIPLSQRQKETENENPRKPSGDSGTRDESSQLRLPDDISLEFSIPSDDELFDPEDFSPTATQDYNSKDGSGKKILNDDFQLVEFLATKFPGFSIDSLVDVFSANNGDMDATVEMLTQLELHTDAAEHLPDTLDIGEVFVPGLPANKAVLPRWRVNQPGEASSSSASAPPAYH